MKSFDSKFNDPALIARSSPPNSDLVQTQTSAINRTTNKDLMEWKRKNDGDANRLWMNIYRHKSIDFVVIKLRHCFSSRVVKFWIDSLHRSLYFGKRVFEQNGREILQKFVFKNRISEVKRAPFISNLNFIVMTSNVLILVEMFAYSYVV